jgi:hypothetical protein
LRPVTSPLAATSRPPTSARPPMPTSATVDSLCLFSR